MADPYNPSQRQNIDWVFTLTAKSGGAPIDLTGYVIKLEAKDSAGTAVLILTIGSGITVAVPATGVASFRATGAQIAAIPVGSYLFNIKANPAGTGTVATEWLVGTLNVLAALA